MRLRAQAVEVVGRSAAGDWLKLADGTWIAAFLVDGVPPGLSIAEAPLPPAAPTVEERANVAAAPVEPPTATPAPPPPAPAPVVRQQQADCDPSYPSVCIPSPPPDLDCGEIPYRRFSVVGRIRTALTGITTAWAARADDAEPRLVYSETQI